MKTILHKGRASVALTASLLAISMGLSRADLIYYQNTFDNSGSFQTTANYNPPPISVRFDSGTATASSTFSAAWASGPTYDAGASAGSGSVEVSWTWNYTADGAGSCALTIDLFPAQITNASAISFDIMLDPSSTPGGYNDYGYFQVATRDESYNWNNTSLGEGLITAAGGTTGVWAHVNIPLSGVNTDVRAITIQDYVDSGRAIDGPEIFYIDNLTIYQPGVVLPPTNSISKTGAKGLYLLTTPNVTVDAQQYQRQGIRTVASGYSWVGSGANPVTYSVTITNFPGPAYSNFEAYVFLVPGTPTEVNPDWNEPTVASLSIQNNADGTATATFGYKLDDSSDNPTTLGIVTNTSVLGTWTMAFENDNDLVITSPGGATLNTNLDLFSSGDGGNFSGPLTVYLGVEPNYTNNTGQQAIISQFQIVSNGIPLLSDAFTSPTLNTNTWAVAAEDPGGVLQVPPSAAYTLTWNLPDIGFNLQANKNLANTGSWFDPGLPKSLFNGQRTVLIPASWAATNNPGFFRLINP